MGNITKTILGPTPIDSDFLNSLTNPASKVEKHDITLLYLWGPWILICMCRNHLGSLLKCRLLSLHQSSVMTMMVSTIHFHIFKNSCNTFLLPRKKIGLHCLAVFKALLFISWLVSKHLSFSFVKAKNPHGHHFLPRGLKPTPCRFDFLLFSQCYFCT